MKILICKHCRKDFEPEKHNSKRQIYCSKSCKSKDYYENNKEKILGDSKNYYKNHSEVKKQHRNYARNYRPQHREELRINNEKYHKRMREKIREEIGIICIICGSNNEIHYHEIHGKKHSYTQYYILTHSEDFVPLCNHCHLILHHYSLLENKKINFEKLNQLVNILKN